MEGMTQVSVESKDAKGLLPGYITVVVVVSAWDKSSGITVGACFCQVTIVLQEDSCHNKLSLLLSSSSHTPNLENI